MKNPTKVPKHLKAGIAALMLAIGSSGALYYKVDNDTAALLKNEYIQAVASDTETSESVKLAMVMAAYYESSYKHIGTPYVDKLGKGQPLTVCNGITGKDVIAGKYYTPAECYRLERRKYLEYEKYVVGSLPNSATYSAFQKASIYDFLHNKGSGAFESSTMKRKFASGDVVGGCKENVRWNKGTIKGVSTVLPGLQLRGDANAELCEKGLT